MEFRVKKMAVKDVIDGTMLYFLVENTNDVNKVSSVVDKARGMTLTLKRKKDKSRRAENYMWSLCDKIAKVIGEGMTKYEVYRTAIEDVGVYMPMTIDTANIEASEKLWCKNNIGRMVKVVYEQGDLSLVWYYSGASDYNAEQMNRLVSHVVSMAKDLDIDTITPDEQAHMIALWGGEDG